MSPYVGKLAPITVVLAAAVYGTLSILLTAGSKDQGKPQSKPPEFSAAFLAPKLLPPAQRNPFQLSSEETKVATGAKQGGAKAAGSQPGKAKPADPKLPNGDLAGFVLSATCIIGEQRSAIVNGRAYKPMEKLDGPNADSPPFVVAEILPDRVLLECQGRRLQLGYSDITAAPAADNPRSPPADSQADADNAANKNGH